MVAPGAVTVPEGAEVKPVEAPGVDEGKVNEDGVAEVPNPIRSVLSNNNCVTC